MKIKHLILIVIVLAAIYFFFLRRSGNPFLATDSNMAPGLLHSTRF